MRDLVENETFLDFFKNECNRRKGEKMVIMPIGRDALSDYNKMKEDYSNGLDLVWDDHPGNNAKRGMLAVFNLSPGTLKSKRQGQAIVCKVECVISPTNRSSTWDKSTEKADERNVLVFEKLGIISLDDLEQITGNLSKDPTRYKQAMRTTYWDIN